MVGCAVVRFADGKTNIAFTGVAENAFRDTGAEQAITGKPINEENLTAALNAALQNIEVLGDHYASVPYRKHLAKVYLKKALGLVSGK
jgi:carbon-monoxide dehydrogenase medium subunit